MDVRTWDSLTREEKRIIAEDLRQQVEDARQQLATYEMLNSEAWSQEDYEAASRIAARCDALEAYLIEFQNFAAKYG